MLNEEQLFIKEHIFSLVESDFKGGITVEEFDGVSVDFDGENAVIGCKDKLTFSRGLFLLAKDYKKGPFKLEQKPRFECLRFTLDVARNGVFTIDAIKRCVVKLAALGFTHLGFNFEDVFELEGYPRFGYLRGRYTKAELKEINKICEAFGISVMPGVQSLAHMSQYLQWPEAGPIRDTAACLLVDEPKTYEFLEKAYALMRECFPKSKYIYTFLDETMELGRGNFLTKNGYEPQMSIYNRHVARVFALCDKYGFRPIMSGDMFARAASINGGYIDRTVQLHMTEDLVKGLPENLIIEFWDYHHTDKAIYDAIIKEYQKLNRQLAMAGALRTYDGFVEDTYFSYISAVPFLRSAIDNGEKIFTCNTWGDYGAETNFMESLGSLPIYSEHCYRGLDCTKEDIFEVSEFLTKMPFQNMFEFSNIHSTYHGGYRFTAKILYTDLFFDLVNITYDYEKVLADILYVKDKAAEYMSLNDRHHDYYEYIYYVAKLMAKKVELLHKIRPAYKNGDRQYLNKVANDEIPNLVKDYETFIEIFTREWMRDKKANGLETILIRLGGICAETRFRAKRLNDYLNGEISNITELDEELIVDDTTHWSNKIMTPSAIQL